MCSASSVGSMNCSGIGLVGNCGVSSMDDNCLRRVGSFSWIFGSCSRISGCGGWSSSGGWSNFYSSRADLCSMLADSRSSWLIVVGCGMVVAVVHNLHVCNMVVTILDLKCDSVSMSLFCIVTVLNVTSQFLLCHWFVSSGFCFP